MKNIVLAGVISIFTLTACKKDDNKVAEKTLEQQKLEFQARQLDIEKQKLAIERERFAYEAQKRTDSIAEVEKAKTAAAAKPQVIRETKTIYRDAPSSSNNGSQASNSSSQGTTAKKKGISEAAKGTAIGVVSGAALGAIVNKKNRGGGAVVGGIIGGATGYTLGRSQDRKSGRVQPK
ncbi:glycine zipper domain-containing protein [Chryseobacterium scophthalmum]|uniref:YMGG-like Gly-zipper n=1 Tax=Chryseobacterium scophthalmum TaxID=59733 RepID=A0A1N6GBX7_9FLAO|nr:glycine zipper domain-containing protein [Chryseobacterium scophthalmum]SIO05025.1 YMGG-like Gly-zipper [Chryseobacterium scophthalmum]